MLDRRNCQDKLNLREGNPRINSILSASDFNRVIRYLEMSIFFLLNRNFYPFERNEIAKFRYAFLFLEIFFSRDRYKNLESLLKNLFSRSFANRSREKKEYVALNGIRFDRLLNFRMRGPAQYPDSEGGEGVETVKRPGG